MRTKHYAVLAALAAFLLASPAGAQDEKKAEPKAPAAKKAEPAKPAAKVATKKEVPASQPVAAKKEQPTSLPSGMPDIKPPSAPEGTDDVVSLLKAIMAAGKEGKWALLVGLILMLLTKLTDFVIATFFKKQINPKALPWIAIGLGVLGQVSFQLAAGGTWLDAILGGVSLGVGAAGTYSALGRYLPGLKPKSKAAAPPADKTKEDGQG